MNLPILMFMNNTSLFRISTMHMPFVFRAALRLSALVKVFVSYLQCICIRHELFADDTTLQAYMTPQVCYLEKILQMHISQAVIINPTPIDVIMFREDELLMPDLFIDDSGGHIFYTEAEFGLAEFSVIIPVEASQLLVHAREILNAYKLPGTIYTIILQ